MKRLVLIVVVVVIHCVALGNGRHPQDDGFGRSGRGGGLARRLQSDFDDKPCIDEIRLCYTQHQPRHSHLLSQVPGGCNFRALESRPRVLNCHYLLV